MTSITFQFTYALLSLGGNQYSVQALTPDGAATLTEQILPNNSTFDAGDLIRVEYGAVAFADNFIGQFQGGVVTSSGALRFLYSNDPDLVGQTFFVDPSPFPYCFYPGTRILTARGEVAVEDLAIGDTVVGTDGSRHPVLWLGQQTVMPRFADPLRFLPIEIAAGALGEGLPARDLRLSPFHALYLGGVLVEAAALVNGTTIRRVERAELPARFTYLHVETEAHALILAEGVPAETFVDNGTRRAFDNWAEYEALHGAEGRAIPEMDLPRATSARQLPLALRDALAARAAPRQSAA